MNELAPCSVLRVLMEYRRYGDGIEKPYMEAMRSQGVKRAYFEVHKRLTSIQGPLLLVAQAIPMPNGDSPGTASRFKL